MAFLYFLKYLKTCFLMFARGIEKPLIIFTKKLHLKTSVQKEREQIWIQTYLQKNIISNEVGTNGN